MGGGTSTGNSDTVIAHYGVKGMRWGVHKSQNSSGSSMTRDHRSEDSTNVQRHLNTINEHGVKALSNKELQEVVTRLNLHQQYSNLTNAKSSVDKGHDAVKKILAVHKTISGIHKAYNSPEMKAIRAGIKTVRFAKKAAGKTGGYAAKVVVKQLMK